MKDYYAWNDLFSQYICVFSLAFVYNTSQFWMELEYDVICSMI